MIRNVYIGECPNCGGSIDDERLLEGLVCRQCLDEAPRGIDFKKLIQILEKNRKLKNLGKYKGIFNDLERFVSFFRKAMDSSPWSAQRTWALRIFMGKSFSIIAPTGVGKTVFGSLMALYLSTKGQKSYLILPTTTLVIQVVEKLEAFREKLGLSSRILYFHSRMGANARKEALAKLEDGEYDVLVTTSRFMITHSDMISKHRHALFFADDVDAVLRSNRSILSLLKAMGFTEDDIRLGEESLRLRRKLAILSASGDGGESAEKLAREFAKIQRKISEKRRHLKSVLVVSSATGRPRGPRVLLFRELLGFYAGGRPELLRNIVDAHENMGEEPYEKLYSLVKSLGSGGIIYVPVDRGVEEAERIAGYLSNKGIKAEAFHSKNQASLKKFADGEIDVLVGVSVYYGVLVRGIDLPWRIRYAVFVGVPRFRFSLMFENPHPVNIIRMLSILSESSPPEVKREARALFINLRRLARRLSPAALQMIAQRLREGKVEGQVDSLFSRAAEFIRKALEREDVREALKTSREIVIKEESGNIYIYIPDTMTYIQASGRTSRLFAGGLTKGLSITLVDDERLYRILSSRLKWYVEGFDPKPLKELDLAKILEEIDSDRERVLKIIRGEVKGKVKDLVKTVLMIVESPNKARTIAGFFGKPSLRILGENLRVYEVTTGDKMLIITASGGHVVDLPPSTPREALEKYGFKKELYGVMVDEEKKKYTPTYDTIKRCLVCGYQFVGEEKTCPRCGSKLIIDKKEILEVLRELSMEADMVLIGTDPDTEGEKIGWDLASLIRPYTKKVVRIEFHEVTKHAIEKAIREPRSLESSLVEAQIVRRVEDRWIGYTISPVLWRDFWRKYCMKYIGDREKCVENRNLSAGRVQTPVLGWIIQRYDEYMKSGKKVLTIGFRIKEGLEKVAFTLEDKKESLRKLKEKKLKIEVTEERDEELAPPPPYTTDSLLSDASRLLRMSASQTMALAQELFELGLITYHRTDSTRVSDTGIRVAREYLIQLYGSGYREYFAPRKWGEGGAHEAIRPTKPIDASSLARLIMEGEMELPRPLTKMHYRLYDLIFKRFIASQMQKAIVTKQKITYNLDGITFTEERIVPPPKRTGFLEMYNIIEFKKRLQSGLYSIEKIDVKTRKTVPLYTQGDVVKLMKERGIGRPSTYATILSKLLQRRYIIEVGKRGKLVPTRLGIEVYKYLKEKYGGMVSEERTRMLEEKMDKITTKEENYIQVLDELYKEIKSNL